MKKELLLNFIITLVIGILTFAINRYFVIYIGIAALGIMKLFNQLLYYLNLLEMGIGEASTYAFYEPLMKNNYKKISIILGTIAPLYNKISVIIFSIGLFITPLIPSLLKDKIETKILHIYWVLYVINTTVSYLYIKYSILFMADQKFNIVRSIQGISKITCQVLQIIVIIKIQSFIVYILLLILDNLIQYICYLYYYKKNYKKIYTTKERDKSIFINIGRLFWHKLASLVVFNTDLILISKFISLEAVGIYASYLMISQMVASIFNIFINVLRPKVGKFIAKHTKEEVFFLWKKLNILFLFFSLVAIMSIYFLIDDFIKLWLGEKFIFSKLTTILILINFFIYFSRMITDIFKEGDGFFEDTNLPILEAIINFLISLILVNLIGINGVIIGTIVSNILIICIARPILVFKRCFNKGTNEYIKIYRQYLFFIMVTILISCLIINNIPIFIVETWFDFILKATIVGGINFVLILIIFLKNSDFRKNYKLLVLE